MADKDGPKRDERFDENFTIRVSRSMRERIDRLAAQEDRSAGYIARLALEKGLPLIESERLERGGAS